MIFDASLNIIHLKELSQKTASGFACLSNIDYINEKINLLVVNPHYNDVIMDITLNHFQLLMK